MKNWRTDLSLIHIYLIRFNNHQSFGIPTYYVWKMFGQNRGEYVVRSEDEGGRCLLYTSKKADSQVSNLKS